MTVRRIAQRIRHLPGLERAEWLWSVLRKPYRRLFWLQDISGRGVKVFMGKFELRIPWEYADTNWERYEPESVRMFVDWIARHPRGIVLDIGSSTGIYSAIALFAGPNIDVVAFDSDLASLAATRRMSQYAVATEARLRLVYGFLSQTATDPTSLASAVKNTEIALEQTGIRVDAATTRYVFLDGEAKDSIPCRRLDDLFAEESDERRPVLLKCDVEGAELLVLKGGENLLQQSHPDLLLAIHPTKLVGCPGLPSYGHSKEQVYSFLQRLGYEIRCLAVDHEEHWWCQFKRITR
jgi:FkbM family methyltransferase